MSQLPQPAPPGFEDLSIDEQIAYVQELWDYIANRPESFPLSGELKAALEQRIERHRQNPDEGRPWEEVRAELVKRTSKH